MTVVLPGRLKVTGKIQSKLGERTRALRKMKKYSLDTLSEKTGLSKSTLYKVESNRMSLTYDSLIKLSTGLGCNIANLFESDDIADQNKVPDTEPKSFPGRLSVDRADECEGVKTKNYEDIYLCTALSQRRFNPVLTRVLTKSLEEFGELSSHAGDEFSYVLEGAIEFHSEVYAPIMLNAGDSIFFDSEMPHAYICASDSPATVLTVCAGAEDSTEP